MSVELESLTDQFTVLSEDRARVDPEVWEGAARAINQREQLRMRYQRFDGVVRDYLLSRITWRRITATGIWWP